MTQLQSKATNYATPIAIIIAGALIGLGFYLSSNKQTAPNPSGAAQEKVDTTAKIRKVDDSDYYKGPRDAKVTIVEYSDMECPFCKRHHQTMQDVIKETKDVKWVFRQFPLDSLHPRNARKAALAAECVGKLGGNNAFWIFTDAYFRDTPTNDRWDIADNLKNLVGEAGVNIDGFYKCYDGKELADKVQADVDNAIATGGRGTPWGVVITKSGKTMPLNGSQPKEAIKQILEFARTN